jgi:hypothetical protein
LGSGAGIYRYAGGPRLIGYRLGGTHERRLPTGIPAVTTSAAASFPTFNTPANKAKDGFSVSGTSCIANSGGNTFTCIITETPGGQQTLTVTVAADGSTWISKADS